MILFAASQMLRFRICIIPNVNRHPLLPKFENPDLHPFEFEDPDPHHSEFEETDLHNPNFKDPNLYLSEFEDTALNNQLDSQHWSAERMYAMNIYQ